TIAGSASDRDGPALIMGAALDLVSPPWCGRAQRGGHVQSRTERIFVEPEPGVAAGEPRSVHALQRGDPPLRLDRVAVVLRVVVDGLGRGVPGLVDRI